MIRRALPILLALALPACGGKSPSGPSPSPGSSGGGLVQGQTVYATNGAAGAGLSVTIGRQGPVVTDGGGLFQVEVGGPGIYTALVQGGSVVERRTTVSGPTPDRARLSLIPASFDLAAFDEMFRTSNARLQRWTTRPSLVVMASTMLFSAAGDVEVVATSEQMSDQEVASMTAHLTEGLAVLTGGTYTSFSNVAIERPSAGSRVRVLRNGTVVVARYHRLASLTGTIGYGLWSEQSDGAVNGGSMFLDRDYDRDDDRRRLLRLHELGHALGYQHVTRRPSILNPVIGSDVTAFDRDAAVIAYDRPPGNRAPDTDPSFATGIAVAASGGSRWSRPIFCR
jgi:hypothetical protein